MYCEYSLGEVLIDSSLIFFFFQAEDGIRDGHVTGVQTCALPISWARPLYTLYFQIRYLGWVVRIQHLFRHYHIVHLLYTQILFFNDLLYSQRLIVVQSTRFEQILS